MKGFLTVIMGIGLAVSPAVAQEAARLGRPQPAASLGLPKLHAEQTAFKATVRAAAPDPLVGDYIPAARLGPIQDVRMGGDPAAEPFGTPQERYNWGLRDDARAPASYYTDAFDSPRMRATPTRRQPQQQSRFGERIGDIFEPNGGGGGGDFGGQGRGEGGNSFWSFESDHCFDEFISPVSNPFLAEDPRTLTEIRPIFLYQTIPNSNPLYSGGNVQFFGVQGRLALTQRFSIVLNKLGAVAINPGSGTLVGSSSGFAEIWLGPKYNWYREDQTGTISSVGAIFQLPIGPSTVYQDTGSLSIVPYINVAQRFGKTSWGTFNVMDTFGVALSADSERSNYFYNSFHVDFDVANWQRIYPLIEVNWFHYTSNGSARPTLGFEGMDFANTGSAESGFNFLSLAIGGRYKFSEAVQAGISMDFTLIGNNALQNFRLGTDAIWRY